MKNRRLITGLSIFFLLIAIVAYLGKPVAHYNCAANDAVALDLKFFRSGNFTLIGHFAENDPKFQNVFSYAGIYTSGPNTFDLNFTGLSRPQVEKLFANSTAGGFVENTATYRMNKNTDDGANKIYLQGCLLTDRRA